MEIFILKFDLPFKYDNFSENSCTFALDFTFGALLAALGIVKTIFTLLSLAQILFNSVQQYGKSRLHLYRR